MERSVLFEATKRAYDQGVWDKEYLLMITGEHRKIETMYITEAEYEEITGEKYEVPK